MLPLRAFIAGTAWAVVLPQLLASCSAPWSADVTGVRSHEPSEIVFLVQSEIPTVMMEALFEGRVSADPKGCLRLTYADPATVVWPKGFTLRERGGELWVLNGAGREVGRIGGSFRLGGGEVPTLHAGLPIAPADVKRANESCPGRFWIVGEIPGS